MSNSTSQRLGSQGGIFLIIIIGVVILALFYVVFIRATMASIEGLDRQIAELQIREEQQKRLMPVYARLMSQQPIDIPEQLSLPEKTPLPREEIAAVIPWLRDLAGQVGLTTVSVAPRLETLDQTPGYLSVDTVVMGNYFALREYLFALGRLPYLGGIETIAVRRTEAGGAEKHITLKLWLNTT